MERFPPEVVTRWNRSRHNGGDPDVVYSDLCWLLHRDANDLIVLAEVVITTSGLVLREQAISTRSSTDSISVASCRSIRGSVMSSCFA